VVRGEKEAQKQKTINGFSFKFSFENNDFPCLHEGVSMKARNPRDRLKNATGTD